MMYGTWLEPVDEVYRERVDSSECGIRAKSAAGVYVQRQLKSSGVRIAVASHRTHNNQSVRYLTKHATTPFHKASAIAAPRPWLRRQSCSRSSSTSTTTHTLCGHNYRSNLHLVSVSVIHNRIMFLILSTTILIKSSYRFKYRYRMEAHVMLYLLAVGRWTLGLPSPLSNSEKAGQVLTRDKIDAQITYPYFWFTVKLFKPHPIIFYFVRFEFS